MKVVFLNATGQLGGAERLLICLLKALRTEKPDWSLKVVVGDTGPLIPLLNKLGFDVKCLQMPQQLIEYGEASAKNPLSVVSALMAGIGYRNELQRLLSKHLPDIVHTMNFKTHVLASYTRIPGSRLCWHMHDFVSNRRLAGRLLRRLSLRPAFIVAISESVAEDLRTVFKPAARISTVLNAVDIHHFTPKGSTWPKGPTFSVGFIATFARWKGHEVFLRAVASLPFRVQAYIVGGPVYKTFGSQINLKEIDILIQSLGLKDHVTFTGFLEDTAPLLRSMDVVVHASTEPEPFGLTVAEGMACGRAVVASMAGGVPEFLEHKQNGFGHSPGDVAGLAWAMETLLVNAELRREIGRRARQTAVTRLSPARMAQEFIEISIQAPDMKVLHISAGNMYGGVETVLVTMARERRQCLEIKPHFAVCFESRFSRELRATGAPVDYLGNVRMRNPLSILRARAALDRLLSQEAIDVAICHSPWAHTIFGPVVTRFRIPLVFWTHGFVNGRHWIEVLAKRILPALVVCNSLATQATVRSLFPNVPSQVIYAPISNSAQIRARTQPEPSNNKAPVVIIQVSRMEPWKGQELLLGALEQLKEQSDWVCWIVGGAQSDRESSYELSLQQKAIMLGLADRVHFLGERDDVPALLAEADIFCQPNLSPEPFGIVFIEALQAGIPVVSSRLGGVSEIVTSDCGILVPAGEPQPLTSALRELIENAQKRIELGLAGPDRARTLCDPQSQLGKLRAVLQSLF